MTLRTKLTERLRIRAPILQAPMSGALAAADGLGMVGGGDPQFVGAEWSRREFLPAGNQYVGFGFITWARMERSEFLDLALGLEPAALITSFNAAKQSLFRAARRRDRRADRGGSGCGLGPAVRLTAASRLRGHPRPVARPIRGDVIEADDHNRGDLEAVESPPQFA